MRQSGLGSTDPESRFRFLADELSALLLQSGLKVALIGGQATNYWARPRFTDDFDFTVSADSGAIGDLVERLKEREFQVVREQAGGSPSGPDFVRLERGRTHDAIDLIVAKTEYQELLIERAIRAEPVALPIATPEDLVILKLIANRSKDQQDIFRIVEAQPIDWEYVEHWAEVWEVADSLRKLRHEIENERPGLPK
jgi:hypothetical protein